ncbi:MAG: hypothetical protein H6624_13725 [Bdellovibrionaceae bacterium]|nr:hypothetical protein [Bdellovibrionales bacterium]MCB9085399.1 hypothetical protein [Pseudobdellovibrionaceae bacterium]
MKKFLVLLLPLFLVIGFTSCSSSDIDSDEAAEAGASDSGDMAEGGDDELIEGGDSDGFEEGGDDLAIDGTDGGGDDLTSEGESEFAESSDVGDSMSEDGFTDDGFADEAGGESDDMLSDISEEPAGDMADSGDGFEPTPEPTETADLADSSAPAYEEETTSEDTSSYADSGDSGMSAASGDDMGGMDEPKKWVPVKKIASTPYRKNGVLVNAVYLARPDDTMDGISQKIYGANKKEELYKVNTTLRSRGVKVGDKVYYNSPRRPADENQLMTFYEDSGMSADIYTAKDGENIRVISKKLLGNENSWKEVWATNADVESKGELAEGTQLRYWAAGAAAPAPPPMAAAPADDEMPEVGGPTDEPPEMAMTDELPPPPAGDFEAPPPPPPPTEVADLDTPPPPPPGDFEAPPPPPPPVGAGSVEPPPPPPPAEPPPGGGDGGPTADAMSELDFLNSDDPNQTMALGVGALLLLASVALFVVVRKKKRRQSLDFNTTTQTQIE